MPIGYIKYNKYRHVLVMDNIDVNKRYICRIEFMRAFIYGTI